MGFTVAARRDVVPAAYRERGPLMPITGKRYDPTFVAPVSDPGGATRPECWGAVSTNGEWDFARHDEPGTPWSVAYVETGQMRTGFESLTDAREAAAGRLLGQLRTEAVLATRATDEATRAQGQRWLAIHMRMAGATEVEYRCECGGYLATVGRDGTLGHMDACVECVDHLDTSRCDHAADHVFCHTPTTVECAHAGNTSCTRPATPNRGRGCPLDNADDCCLICCSTE